MTETSITADDPSARQPVRDFRLRSGLTLTLAVLPITAPYILGAAGDSAPAGPGSSAVVGQVLQPSGGVTRTRA